MRWEPVDVSAAICLDVIVCDIEIMICPFANYKINAIAASMYGLRVLALVRKLVRRMGLS